MGRKPRIIPEGTPAKKRKVKITKALRDQVWLQTIGKKYEAKCYVTWCHNIINVNNFQCGHDIPESKGGKTELSNLFPICNSCNASMGNRFTLKEWSDSQKQKRPPIKVRILNFLKSLLCRE